MYVYIYIYIYVCARSIPFPAFRFAVFGQRTACLFRIEGRAKSPTPVVRPAPGGGGLI